MMMGRKISSGWQGRWRGAPLLACVLVVGCIGEQLVVDAGPESLWEATLTSPIGFASELPRVTGQAAVAVMARNSRIGIGVDGADRDLYWGIYRDTCDEPGTRLLEANAYPRIPEGTTEIEVTLSLTLDRAEDYHIRLGTDPEIEVLVACGNFARSQFSPD